MIGEFLFALVRIAIYFFVFWFIYRVITGVVKVLRGEDQKKEEQGQPRQSAPKKPVQTYTDVEDAKFRDVNEEEKKKSQR